MRRPAEHVPLNNRRIDTEASDDVKVFGVPFDWLHFLPGSAAFTTVTVLNSRLRYFELYVGSISSWKHLVTDMNAAPFCRICLILRLVGLQSAV